MNVPAPSPALFTPLTIRGVTFPNRIILSPMCQYRAIDGVAQRWHTAHHGRLSLAGLGGAIFEATAVLPEGRITPACLGIWSDAHLPGLSELTALYRDRQVPVGIQLAHAGRKAAAATPFDGARPLPADHPDWWASVAPSAMAFGEGWHVPQALTAAGIEAVIAAFVAAARRAVAAGFDFIELHGAHGYLAGSFFSAISNQRDDEFGRDRGLFAQALARAVRAAIPDTMPLFWRTSAVDTGVTIADTAVLAQRLHAAGVDMIDCSSGGTSGPSGVTGSPPAPGYMVPLAAAVKAAGVPSMAVGLIMDGALANGVIAAGEADLVAVGRELLADSSFVLRCARELGLAQPWRVLPLELHFWLERRKYEGMKP
jgi:2,4-dienoyl-CoA reductase-like NADH-dependent reductase (Old Yellow Enzyme family)